jgi:hypothetical protein
MKHFFTLLFFVALGVNLSAQIETDPGIIEGTNPVDTKIEVPLTVTNTSAESYGVHWKIVLGDDWVPEWKVLICDAQLCYPPGTLQNSETKPNEMVGYASSSAWSVKIDANGVVGKSTIKMEFFDGAGNAQEIGSTQVGDIVFETSTAVKDVYTSNLVLYPNPTQHYFSVKNDANIASVSLLSVVGKEMWTKSHSTGASYDVSDLHKGMYLVRLVDQNGKLVKTMRLNKTSI